MSDDLRLRGTRYLPDAQATADVHSPASFVAETSSS